MIVTVTKWCPRCSTTQPFDAFKPQRGRPGVPGGWCRMCRRDARNHRNQAARDEEYDDWRRLVLGLSTPAPDAPDETSS